MRILAISTALLLVACSDSCSPSGPTVPPKAASAAPTDGELIGGEREETEASASSDTDTAAGSSAIEPPASELQAPPSSETSSTLESLIAERLSPVATLSHPDALASNHFGESVALSGDGSRALIGSPSEAQGTGSATLFVRQGTRWIVEATLRAPDAAELDFFGTSVALDAGGSRAIVGADQDDTAAGEDAGSAHVFVRTGTRWTHEALLASGSMAHARFGASVALDANGSLALVGVSSDHTRAPSGGSARVFVRTGTNWTEEAALFPTSTSLVPPGGEHFGSSVALSADGARALVGAPHSDTAPDYESWEAGESEDTGRAHVFVRTGARWTEEARLQPASGRVGDYFGWSVALSAEGGRALVGAPSNPDIDAPGTGSARVFVRDATTWTERATIVASGLMAEDHFGWSVALSADGRCALLGAPMPWPTPRGGNGAAFVFRERDGTWTEQVVLIGPSSNTAQGAQLGDSVTLSFDGRVALVGSSLEQGGVDYEGRGRIYRLDSVR